MDLKVETNKSASVALTGQKVSLGPLFAVLKFFLLVTELCKQLLAADRLILLTSNPSVRMLFTQGLKFILERSPKSCLLTIECIVTISFRVYLVLMYGCVYVCVL
jgi:hypothetical protein